jgi:hypothetical protein
MIIYQIVPGGGGADQRGSVSTMYYTAELVFESFMICVTQQCCYFHLNTTEFEIRWKA